MATVWFITGSSRGLGMALATYALHSGANVVATARTPAALQGLVDRYGSNRLLILPLDVTNYDASCSAADETIKRFGGVEIIVNNAGYGDLSSLEDMDIDAFRKQIDTNLLGVVNVTKAFIPHLRKQGHGHIFQISSVGARVGVPGLSAYQAAKWAVSGLCTTLATELKPLNIHITSLEPGGMRTEWFTSSMTTGSISDPYKDTVGTTSSLIEGAMASDGISKLEKIGPIIVELYKATDPPVRMLVGKDAVHHGEAVARQLRESDEKWKALGCSSSA